jgi:hypothetical protein
LRNNIKVPVTGNILKIEIMKKSNINKNQEHMEATTTISTQLHHSNSVASSSTSYGNITFSTHKEKTVCRMNGSNNFNTEKILDNSQRGNCISDKEKNDIRILYNNGNSLRPSNDGKWRGTLDRIEFLQADLICICETGTNWNNDELTTR